MARTWTFGQKLAAGFAVVVSFALVMGVVGFYSLRTVVDSKDRVIQHTGQDLIDAERLRAAMQRETAELRGYVLLGDPSFAEELRAANQDFAKTLGRIRQRGLTDEGERLISAIEAAEASHQRAVDEAAELRASGVELESIIATVNDEVTPRFEGLAQRVGDFVAHAETERDDGRERASETASAAITILVAVGGGVLLVAVATGFLLTRTLGRQIGASVQHIRSSSAELQAAATQQATGAKEQATAMNEIHTTIGELLASSRQIAESGQHVARMASDSAASARDGEHAVDKATEAIDSIKQQVDTIVEHMLGLGRKSQQIGSILEIINELAEQTNILAINATIEAAGAGDAGRRFAVVGEEIRKLADRVGGSTKEIRELIEQMRAAVNATVMATESGSKTVDSGTERFRELQSSFSQIGELVASTTQAGREIELSTKQQTTAVEQVNVAISNVAQTTRETESSSAQTLQTASELASLSDDLARLVQA